MLRTTMLILTSILALIFISGCCNQSAARLGNRIGQIIGKPLGLVVTTADQALRKTGEIVRENVRQQRQLRAGTEQPEGQTLTAKMPEPKYPTPMLNAESSPNFQQLELLSQQQIETRKEFWQ